MIGQGYVFKKVGDKMFDQDTAKIVRRHAFWACLIMMTPFEIFDIICYCFILWHMYSKLCERANTTLNFGNIVAGFVINIIIAEILSWICIALPPITGVVVYLQFYLSGKSYITTLKNIMGYNYPDTNTSAVDLTTQQLPTAVQPEIQNQPAIQSEYNPPQQESPQTQNSNLLTCPDCGQMVSRRADVCPNCGCPVSEMN